MRRSGSLLSKGPAVASRAGPTPIEGGPGCLGYAVARGLITISGDQPKAEISA